MNKNSPDPLAIFLAKATSTLAVSDAPRNYILTVLRMLSNAFSNPTLTRVLLSGQTRKDVTMLLVATLLHEDAAVRTAAASLAFNVAAYLQMGRVDMVKAGNSGAEGVEEDGDWEVEMVSAVVEAIDREKGSEEVGKSSTFPSFNCFFNIHEYYLDSAPSYSVSGIPPPALAFL
jgi:hypothetical protein